MPFVTLHDVVTADDYNAARDGGYISVRPHPDLPYLIHNYTDRATWEQMWTPATLACRGLITHADTGEVIARPFAKFMNHDQQGAAVWHLEDPVVVMDKVDGSLGVLYPLPDGGHAVSTRGSFVSDQALWATSLWQDRYADAFHPNPDWTYLFEIIYPENRIVVSYGDMRDLVLLGAVDKATGVSVPIDQAAEGWPGPVVEVFPYATLREALTAPVRDNAEGFVVWHPATDSRVKIKLEEYKFLHKLLTGVNSRNVWEVLAAGNDPGDVFAAAPDEFHAWLKTIEAELRGKFDGIVADARALFDTVVADLPQEWGRKEFALAATTVARGGQAHLKSLLFLLLDGKALDEPVWRMVRPVGESTVRSVSADAD